jgi:transmembrane protein
VIVMPTLIAKLLDQNWFMVLARIVLTSAFWASGLSKSLDFQAGAAEMTQLGFSNPVLINVLTFTTQLIGSALIIVNRWTWLGAGMLAVFTALTIPLVHHFWTMTGEKADIHFFFVGEHLSMIGGLMLVCILSRLTGGPGNGPKRKN